MKSSCYNGIRNTHYSRYHFCSMRRLRPNCKSIIRSEERRPATKLQEQNQIRRDENLCYSTAMPSTLLSEMDGIQCARPSLHIKCSSGSLKKVMTPLEVFFVWLIHRW
uniref:Uncharacterized protein n=1 Tax=Setaria viridis TaxID=4556 RepID=A0A4U6WFJ0_SETVI|nr:hypothetical protein SEVIR_1G327533v2 [Setaria viridis]